MATRAIASWKLAVSAGTRTKFCPVAEPAHKQARKSVVSQRKWLRRFDKAVAAPEIFTGAELAITTPLPTRNVKMFIAAQALADGCRLNLICCLESPSLAAPVSHEFFFHSAV